MKATDVYKEQKKLISEYRTCDKCKYWDNGFCSNDNFIDVSKTVEFEDLKDVEDKLQYHDSESYKAHFITGPKFGCIHWSD